MSHIPLLPIFAVPTPLLSKIFKFEIRNFYICYNGQNYNLVTVIMFLLALPYKCINYPTVRRAAKKLKCVIKRNVFALYSDTKKSCK